MGAHSGPKGKKSIVTNPLVVFPFTTQKGRNEGKDARTNARTPAITQQYRTMSDLSPLTTSQLLSILAPIRLPQTTNITPFTSFSFSSTLAPFRSKNSISSPFKFQNWARTFSCSPSLVFLPSTTLHCRLITEYARRTDVDDDAGAGELTDGRRKKKAAMTVRAFGVGHSPSDLACTEEIMVKTTGMDKVVDVSVCRVCSVFFFFIAG